MNIRTLIKSTVGALGTLGPLGAFKPAHATTHNGSRAVYFDGFTRLQNDGGIPAFPNPGSPYLFASYWYNGSSSSWPFSHTTFNLSTFSNAPGADVLQIAHLTGSRKNTAYLSVTVTNGAGSLGMIGHSNQGTLPYNDGKFHLVQIRANMQTS